VVVEVREEKYLDRKKKPFPSKMSQYFSDSDDEDDDQFESDMNLTNFKNTNDAREDDACSVTTVSRCNDVDVEGQVEVLHVEKDEVFKQRMNRNNQIIDVGAIVGMCLDFYYRCRKGLKILWSILSFSGLLLLVGSMSYEMQKSIVNIFTPTIGGFLLLIFGSMAHNDTFQIIGSLLLLCLAIYIAWYAQTLFYEYMGYDDIVAREKDKDDLAFVEEQHVMAPTRKSVEQRHAELNKQRKANRRKGGRGSIIAAINEPLNIDISQNNVVEISRTKKNKKKKSAREFRQERILAVRSRQRREGKFKDVQKKSTNNDLRISLYDT